MANPKPGQPHVEPAWRLVGERGLRVATGAQTLARYEYLRVGNFAEIEDMIVADGSILIVIRRGSWVSAALGAALAASLAGTPSAAGSLHEIAVEYGGAAGPDLPALAHQAGLRVADYIERHAATAYTVAFLGFQPGFAYLRGLPPALCAPRLATPRTRVAAGSVAVGGAYTGIYPGDGPGGWQLVGRARVSLFDPRRDPPVLLLPGDRVRLVPA